MEKHSKSIKVFRNTEKRQILFHRLVGEHTLFPPILLLLLKGEMKIGIIGKTG